MNIKNVLVLLFSFQLLACASQPEQQVEEAENNQAQVSETQTNGEQAPVYNENQISDPLEPVNRIIWDFNYEILDRFIIKPITKGYVAITPQPVRTGLLNFAENIEEPSNTLNNLLEGSYEQSAVSFSRFLINSTVGIIGIFDVATNMGLERAEEDFGQVLGIWGLGTGPYLMLPALGPSDVRSFTGRVVDNVIIPDALFNDPVIWGATGVRIIETRATLLDQEENLNRALDQYLFVRDAYFQRLRYELNDGKLEQKSDEQLEQEEEDFSAFEDMLDDIE